VSGLFNDACFTSFCIVSDAECFGRKQPWPDVSEILTFAWRGRGQGQKEPITSRVLAKGVTVQGDLQAPKVHSAPDSCPCH
jgi:hypothetical protein